MHVRRENVQGLAQLRGVVILYCTLTRRCQARAPLGDVRRAPPGERVQTVLHNAPLFAHGCSASALTTPRAGRDSRPGEGKWPMAHLV